MGDGSGHKILIVDDQSSNIQVAHAAVRDLGKVQFATSGEQALMIAAREMPDLVLLDVVMPGVDGIEVCRRLRHTPGGAPLVVLMTGHDDESVIERGLAEGAVDVIHKPFSPALLRHRVEVLLELRTLRQSAVPAEAAIEGHQPPLRQRVLVVEDGEINRLILLELLQAGGHQVALASSAEEGLALLAQQPFDTVLLDIHLPRMDGVQALGHIRDMEPELGRTHRVIAVTGDALPGSRSQFETVGFEAVVRKPIDPPTLDAALRGIKLPEEQAASTSDPVIDLLIDHERLATLRASHSAVRLKTLFALFQREVRDYLIRLRRAHAVGDLGAVADAAHRMKSALGHFACKRMAAIADRLAHGEHLSGERVTRDVAALDGLLPETLIALRGALDLPPASDG